MWTFEVITPWAGDGTDDDPNRPQIGDDYALAKWEDVVGIPSASLWPDPNLNVVKARCEAAVLDAIEGNNTYYVLSAEEIIDADT